VSPSQSELRTTGHDAPSGLEPLLMHATDSAAQRTRPIGKFSGRAGVRWGPEPIDTRRPLVVRFRGREYRWWIAVLSLYAASRLLSTTFMLTLYLVATAAHWPFASQRENPTFFTFSGSWDSSFYRRIAETGYPTILPTDPTGSILPNPWAFLPVFPWIVRVITVATGLEFYPAGVFVATLAGAGAALTLFRLVAARASTHGAIWATAFFCFSPVAFILQTAYAESLFFLFVFAALWGMIARRYWLVLPIGVLAAFTRPGALAIPLALAIIGVVRLRQSRRMARPRHPAGMTRVAMCEHSDPTGQSCSPGSVGQSCLLGPAGQSCSPDSVGQSCSPDSVGQSRSLDSGSRSHLPDRLPVRDIVAITTTGLVTAVAGLGWPVIAAAVTGVPDAYLRTELSWWTGFVGHVSFVPLTPWFIFANTYLGIGGILLVASVLAGLCWLLTRRSVRVLGVEIVGFSSAYLLYLIAVFLPQQSTFRLLMPLAPLGAARGLTEYRAPRRALLFGGMALQPVALVLLWFVGYP